MSKSQHNSLPSEHDRLKAPSELDLQAFLDNELPSGKRIEIIEWLIEHPEESKPLFEMQLREDLLRTAVWQSVNGVDLDGGVVRSLKSEAEPGPTSNRQRDFGMGFLAGAIVVAIILMLF